MRSAVLTIVAFSFAAPAQAPGWKLEAVQDELTLQKAQKLTLPGVGGKLVLMCAQGLDRARLIIVSDEFVGGARVRAIVYRIGNNPIRNTTWRYSNDYIAEPYSGSELSNILNQLSSQPDALFRLRRYDNGQIDVRIDLSGAAAAIDEWKGACGIAATSKLKADAG